MGIESKVLALLEHAMQAPAGSVKPALRVDAVEGLDSMGVVQFLGSLSDQLDIVVSVDEMQECRTVADIVRVVEGHVARKA